MSNTQNEPHFVTYPCQHCDGGIEFDASDFTKDETRTAECPHCHLETIIFVPKEKAAKPTAGLFQSFKKQKRLILTLATIFLICVIAIGLSSLEKAFEALIVILVLSGAIWIVSKGNLWRSIVDQLESPPPPISALPPANPADTKKCPFCAEIIRIEAKKCKHCGSILGNLPQVAQPKTPPGKFSCPSCQSTHTSCQRAIGCAVLIILFISCGLGLIMIPFLPYNCTCMNCGFKWKS